MSEHLSIRDCIVCVEKRKGITMRSHATLGDLAYSLVFRWPEDHRGNEWDKARAWCLDAMELKRDPEQARAAFVAAAQAAEMLMVREEYIQERPQRRPRNAKGKPQASAN